MSKATTLSDVLNAAPVATSGYKFIGVNSSGEPVKIAEETVNKEVMADAGSGGWKWFRVANLVDSASAIIHLTTGMWCGNPTGLVFSVCLDSSHMTPNNGETQTIIINKLSGSAAYCSKARLVLDGSYRYLDFYIWSRLFKAKVTGLYCTPIAQLDPSIPSTAETKEFTSANWGGVKRCFTTYWKGGAQHEQSHCPNQRFAKRRDDRRTRLPRHSLRHRYVPHSGILSSAVSKHKEHSEWGISIWDIDSQENHIVHHAGIYTPCERFPGLEIQDLETRLDRKSLQRLGILLSRLAGKGVAA